MRQNWLLLALLSLASTGVTSCAKPPPPKVAVQPPPPPPPPPPHKAKPPPVHAPISAKWQFNSPDCSASASGGALSLDISVSARQLALAVRTGGRTALTAGGGAPIGFSGPSGAWSLDGRVTGKHRIAAMQPMSEVTASQIKLLLEGGLVKFGGAAATVPRLRVPNSGQDGRAWFACVVQRAGS